MGLRVDHHPAGPFGGGGAGQAVSGADDGAFFLKGVGQGLALSLHRMPGASIGSGFKPVGLIPTREVVCPLGADFWSPGKVLVKPLFNARKLIQAKGGEVRLFKEEHPWIGGCIGRKGRAFVSSLSRRLAMGILGKKVQCRKRGGVFFSLPSKGRCKGGHHAVHKLNAGKISAGGDAVSQHHYHGLSRRHRGKGFKVSGGAGRQGSLHRFGHGGEERASSF